MRGAPASNPDTRSVRPPAWRGVAVRREAARGVGWAGARNATARSHVRGEIHASSSDPDPQ